MKNCFYSNFYYSFYKTDPCGLRLSFLLLHQKEKAAHRGKIGGPFLFQGEGYDHHL